MFLLECDDSEQMKDVLKSGIKNKHMARHDLNQSSSRSHCIFTVHLDTWESSLPDCVTRSELALVDLAGSERIAHLSKTPSQKLVHESIDINTSLLTLGKVIQSLSAGGRGARHVPYRDSKLTKLLKHTLGGTALTMMIACINPCDAFTEETTSTLFYAGRARNIRNAPRVNEDPRALVVRALREEVAALRTELSNCRQLLQHYSGIEEGLVMMPSSGLGEATGGPELPDGGGGLVLTDVDEEPPGTSSSAAVDTDAVGNGKATLDGKLLLGDERTDVNTDGRDGALSGESKTQNAAAAATAAAIYLAKLPTEASADPQFLANKLVTAVGMLRDLTTRHLQLRASFDTLQQLREQADQSSADLNEENSRLRERIEILESTLLRQVDSEKALERESKWCSGPYFNDGSATGGPLNSFKKERRDPTLVYTKPPPPRGRLRGDPAPPRSRGMSSTLPPNLTAAAAAAAAAAASVPDDSRSKLRHQEAMSQYQSSVSQLREFMLRLRQGTAGSHTQRPSSDGSADGIFGRDGGDSAPPGGNAHRRPHRLRALASVYGRPLTE
eukprot:NODE_817_length_1884_cov_27.088283_g749_i0.p1 GENE.NODE_817_length_1884_cov_27.088283_g749_i0~~NODE_817_length_1884_cov_27.088283_g749_i0.p1  ORF type:complete len:558 (+),score=99.13 NODE_817_length_1884_cov_27.088283_g749_i0:121-1794(+)